MTELEQVLKEANNKLTDQITDIMIKFVEGLEGIQTDVDFIASCDPIDRDNKLKELSNSIGEYMSILSEAAQQFQKEAYQ